MWKGLKEGLQPLSKGEEERLRRVFDCIDKDADGVITASGTVYWDRTILHFWIHRSSIPGMHKHMILDLHVCLFAASAPRHTHARLTRKVLQICGRHWKTSNMKPKRVRSKIWYGKSMKPSETLFRILNSISCTAEFDKQVGRRSSLSHSPGACFWCYIESSSAHWHHGMIIMVVIIPPPAADIIFFIHACVDPFGMELRKLFSVSSPRHPCCNSSTT